jgi:hypothetical protein
MFRFLQGLAGVAGCVKEVVQASVGGHFTLEHPDVALACVEILDKFLAVRRPAPFHGPSARPFLSPYFCDTTLSPSFLVHATDVVCCFLFSFYGFQHRSLFFQRVYPLLQQWVIVVARLYFASYQMDYKENNICVIYYLPLAVRFNINMCDVLLFFLNKNGRR